MNIVSLCMSGEMGTVISRRFFVLIYTNIGFNFLEKVVHSLQEGSLGSIYIC